MRTQPNYGIDSPGIVAGLLAAGLVTCGAALAFPHLFHLPIRSIALAAGIYFLFAAGAMLFYSKAGKLGNRDQILNVVPWRGDEVVLDLGCGRGLLLVGAARRLTSGRAVGADVWVRGAVTGNRPQATLENAQIEGVADRTEVTEGDARHLPFADNSFDVVVSNFVLHELKTAEEREKMTREIVRVLKPGGYVSLIDFLFTDRFAQVLQDCGMDTRRLRVGRFSFYLSAILNLGLVRTCQVIASKPVQTRM
jgi:SAM-dependent methyltransferase